MTPNLDENADFDRQLTATLYGGDANTRIKQELVLDVGGMRALAALGLETGVVRLNEGHCAFAALEAARMRMERDHRSFHEVFERVAAQTVFTTHTPDEIGHDRFDPELVEQTVGPLRERLGIGHEELLDLGRVAHPTGTSPFA